MNDSQDPVLPIGKISRGEAGLGTVSPEMVEERAREIALTDGRTAANEQDREAAQSELLGPPNFDLAPETVDSDTENLVAWDEPIDAGGQRAHTVRPEDDLNESSIAEALVEEGMDEADHDQRVSAALSDPPEEV